jgi:hypothetical protein
MWPQFIITALGLWVMVSPVVIEYSSLGQDHVHVIGPCVVSIALIAMSEAMRSLRKVNILLGGWLALAPLFLDLGSGWLVVANHIGCGIAIAGLSLIQGKITHQLAGGWSALWNSSESPCSPSM